MPSPVVDLLANLGAALGALEVPWFLFGAQAAILHRAARLTADVDVTVRLPESVSPDARIQTLQDGRFQARFTDAAVEGLLTAFAARSRVLPQVHLPTGLPLDIVIAGPGLEDQFFERVIVREIDHVRVPVASPEDVVVMKVLAGRPKDDEDVAAILAAHRGALDLAYVRATLTTLEAALAQSDLLPALPHLPSSHPACQDTLAPTLAFRGQSQDASPRQRDSVMTGAEVRRWIARFEAVAEIERAERVAAPASPEWALGVSLPLIDAACAAMASAPALAARRADDDSRVRAIWDRLRLRLRP